MKNLKDYLGKKVAIACRTDEEAKFVNDFLKNNGGRCLYSEWECRFTSSEKYHNCIEFDLDDLPFNCYCYGGYHATNGYTVYEASEFMDKKSKHKFKIGDKVRFKSSSSKNAKYFEHGLENLEIRNIYGDSNYDVYESDKSTSWSVGEDELEFMEETSSSKEIPKYVECIRNYGISKIGEIFDTNNEEISRKNHNFTWRQCLIEFKNLGKNFKPSTEQEYLKQFNTNEKYEVGEFFFYDKDLYQINSIDKDNVFISGFGHANHVKNSAYPKNNFYGGTYPAKSWRKAELHEIDCTKLSNEEILKIANYFYPKGTKHKGVSGRNYIVTGDLYIEDNKIYSKEEPGCIYHKEQNSWAKIISKPSVKVGSYCEETLKSVNKDLQKLLEKEIWNTTFNYTNTTKIPLVPKESFIKSEIIPTKVRGNVAEELHTKRVRTTLVKKSLI